MSGNVWLDGLILAVSICNMILMLWLGLTILLTAEKRTWGVWLASGGMFAGSIFFISHSAILGQDLSFFPNSVNLWWHIGWFPIIAAPFAWYIGVLWYAGYWDDRSSDLRARHRKWLMGLAIFAAALFLLLIFWNIFPALIRSSQTGYEPGPTLTGIPILFVSYPIYILLCISLSLDTLIKPGPSRRLMGREARQRARPWLVAVSLDLLGVSLLVSIMIIWVLTYLPLSVSLPELYIRFSRILAWFDLVVETLIGAAVLMVGQAVVAYEIFTGKNLPRRGLRRQWRSLMLMAALISVVMAWSLSENSRPVYGLLLAVVLVVVFFAVMSGRMYAEREDMVRQMRPLVASQQIVPSLLQPANPLDLTTPFTALCKDFLNVDQGCLVPLGALASLGIESTGYPDPHLRAANQLEEILPLITDQVQAALPLDEAEWKGMAWALPLWSERGLIGLLLLGEKLDGGLLTQEEIEIARMSGERLLDIQASTQLSIQLMHLQRDRMTQSQWLDRQTRRVLHDDILPRIHTTLLTLSTAQPFPGSQTVMDNLSDTHRQLSRLLHDLPAASVPQVQRLGLAGALRKFVEDEAVGYFTSVDWKIDPAAEIAAKKLPQLEVETVYYAVREAVRNAAHHGRGQQNDRPLNLSVKFLEKNGLTLIIQDDGVGMQLGAPRGESTHQGLAIHSAMLALIGGTLVVESKPDQFTRLTIQFPC